MAKDWESKAVPKSHRGVFTAKAHAAGMSVPAYAHKEKKAKGRLGKEARFALEMEHKSHGK
jgi:hypothetical protein